MGRQKETEKTDRVVALFAELKSTRLVADRIGISVNTVHHHLKLRGLKSPRLGCRTFPNAACERNAQAVLQMCQDGWSLTQIGKVVGTRGGEVKKFLRRQGVTKEFQAYAEGEKHHFWKGRLIDKDGYVLIHCKGHPLARKHSHYIFEHRLVMEQSLGRFLLPTEVIHHRNGDKKDNRPENLQVFQSNGEHLAVDLAVDLAGRCPNWSQDGKERIQKANRQRWSDWRAANPVS